MPRLLQPEFLDSLPPDHPDALNSRRDLLAINGLLGNHRWFERTLPGLLRPDERVLEIGAGTGELSARLVNAGVDMAGLDFCPKPVAWSEARKWHCADLRTFAEYTRYPVIIGNLIFHHFNDRDLAALGSILGSNARLIMASEPARRPFSQTLFRATAPFLSVNHVTRHDADVSIKAGFIGNELPRALGLTQTARLYSPPEAPATLVNNRARSDKWDIVCTETLLGAYRMIAIRRPMTAAPSIEIIGGRFMARTGDAKSDSNGHKAYSFG
jgi:2-polyprenyl-3-methyl-5-hydroxy-6-metoxy-1,4-benzoquinol methylase